MTEKIAVKFNDLVKQYPGSDTMALNHVSLDIEAGEFVVILGSSGSGKTTLLKTVNRLIEPDSGYVEFFGQNVEDLDPIELRRQIGYVVQEVGLFPHMTVKENIATVPRLLDWDEDRIDQRVDELLEMVDLDPDTYRDRKPKELSGGQRQRVGVARGLAGNPDVFLLDEPFGAVDAITRLSLQEAILDIHNQMSNKTFLFVTHDINEAFRLGSKILIMHDGVTQQYDSPREIARHPATKFVDELIDTVREQEDFWRSVESDD